MKQKSSRMIFRIRIIIALGMVLVIGIRAGNVATALLLARRLAANNNRVTDSVELVTRLMDLSSHLKDAEIARTGFVISGARDSLAQFQDAAAQTTVALLRIGELAQKSPSSHNQFELLKKFAKEKVDEMRTTIAVRQEKGAEAARALSETNRRAELSSAISPLIAELKAAERMQLTQRTAESAGTIRHARGNLLGMTALAFVSLVALYLFLTHLINSLHRDEQALREQAQRWHVTLANIDDATIVTDPQGKISFLNLTALALCGCREDDAIGRPLESVFKIVSNDPRTDFEPVAHVIALGQAMLSRRATLVTREGKERPIIVRAVPIREPDGTTRDIVLVFRDVTQQVRAEEEHRENLSREQENTRRLQELARLSTQLHLAHDFDSILSIVATESQTLLGVRKVEATAEPGETAYSPSGGLIELPITGRDGRILAYFRVTLMQEGDFDDRDRAILHQLVHIASVAIENARLYQELRENDHSKDRFLATLAHELRNPLAAISSAISLGRHGSPQDGSLWSINVIDRQTHRLTFLIDDLLDVSRITQGKLRLRRETVDLGAIMANAVEAVRPTFDQRRHTIETVVPLKKLWVYGDATRLEQIFTNLLTNAAKYTQTGGQVCLTCARDGHEIITRVKDTGIGIAPDLLPRIFDLFTQGDRSIARAEGGLGIGLTLVKTLTELHGGSVSVASDGLDTGSEFTVRLPAIFKPLYESSKPQPRDPHDHPQRPVRILVVDDNVDLAHGLASLIHRLGHIVKATVDGPAALESARLFRPEVVLLDIGLPGMDGYEVAARLRAEETDALVLVAISGYGQDEDRRRSREVGFDFHLVKPIDVDALRQIVNRVSRSTPPAPALRSDPERASISRAHSPS
jgi:PAS domain S-box-containing protein